MSDDDAYPPESFPYVTRSTLARVHVPGLALLDGLAEVREISELTDLLEDWSIRHNQSGYDPLPTLIRMAEIMEEAMDAFLKQMPDPLDDRHPHRTHPNSAFGSLLKHLFRYDDFMNKLIITYLLGRDHLELSVVAARLLLDCVPGLDPSVIFEEPNDFIPQLYGWAKESENEELKAYAFGLLSAAMEVQENAARHRTENQMLIPLALKQLSELKDKMEAERAESEVNEAVKCVDAPGPFANINLDDGHSNSNSMDKPSTSYSNSNDGEGGQTMTASQQRDKTSIQNSATHLGGSTQPMRIPPKKVLARSLDPASGESPPRKKKRTEKLSPPNMTPCASFTSLQDLESNSSRWHQIQPFVIGTHKISPVSIEMHQRLILQYLGPTGEYQDLLGCAYDSNAMDLLLYYIDLEKTMDVRLTFDAIRYLTALLVHRKFALEFVSRGGVAALLRVPRNCMASAAAATALYYLAYSEDVMEAVCQLPDPILDSLVDYCLWCLEHSYESGMSSASMFFTHALFFKAILDRFDARDGLRKLYNYIATLVILQDTANNEEFRLSEEQMYTSTQSVRNASATFRSYLSAHLVLKIEQLRRTGTGKSSHGIIEPLFNIQIIPHKSMMLPEDTMELGVHYVLTVLRTSSIGWRVIEDVKRLGIIKSMLQIASIAGSWTQPAVSRNEMARNALEVLWICTCLPRIHLDFCLQNAELENNSGVSVLLDIADQAVYDGETELQITALKILFNLVFVTQRSYARLDKKESRKSSSRLLIPQTTNMEILEKMWNSLREHNVVMIMNDVVRCSTPVTEADKIRSHAVRVLLGLSRCEAVRQILSQLPLIKNNELLGLMKEPVAPEKKHDHIQFCAAAKLLIEMVTQRSIKDQLPNPKDLTQERLWKSHVVSNTRITYNEKELLQLIHGHLKKKGLVETADQLMKEAELPDVPASRVTSTPARLKPLPCMLDWKVPPQAKRSLVNSLPMTPNMSRQRSIDGTPFPRKLLLRAPLSANRSQPQTDKNLRPSKELDGIITDFFRTQHSQCSKPVSTCPPFSLFFPHRCPEPSSTGIVSANVSHRILQKGTFSDRLLRLNALQDEKFAFSRFRHYRTLQDPDEQYSACAFSCDDVHLVAGLFSGDVRWINYEVSSEDSTTNCHQSAITSVIPSKDGRLALTSSAYIRPLSAIWKLKDVMELQYHFDKEYYIQFSNLGQEKIIGTHGGTATIYDTETGSILLTVGQDPARYQFNRASFSPDDSLIFNDGMIWDVRAPPSLIHSFDKLNIYNSGVFHPHGNEVIINTEVWDLRTRKLLRSVPALDMCKLRFNSTGNIMYAIIQSDALEQPPTNQFSCSLRTFDSSNYTVLSTIDTKRPLTDLCCDHMDRFVAVVERSDNTITEFYRREQSYARIYEVGKVRAEEDEDDDGGEEEQNDGEDDRESSEFDISGSESDASSTRDVFGAIARLQGGMSSTSESDESDEDEDEEDDLYSFRSDSNSSSSSGSWHTDPDAQPDDNNLDNIDDIDEENDEDDDDEADTTYEPEQESSRMALNPHIRREQQRHD